MFAKITWIEYFTALAIVTAGYYLTIGLIFNRTKLAGFFRKLEPDDFEAFDASLAEAEEEEAFQELERVVDDLRNSILGVAEGTSKEQLLVLLRNRLGSFGGLHRATYQDAINHFIIEICEEKCGVRFEERELIEEWKSLPR